MRKTSRGRALLGLVPGVTLAAAVGGWFGLMVALGLVLGGGGAGSS